MPKKIKSKLKKCPKCSREYDPKVDVLITCPECEEEGSTACCNIGGRGCLCAQCEENLEKED